MATIQTQIQLRLGAAREALKNAAGTGREAVSHIQKTAANELIADAVAKNSLSSEDIARISDEINEIQWMPGHADELLQSLICKTDQKKRREQHFAFAFCICRILPSTRAVRLMRGALALISCISFLKYVIHGPQPKKMRHSDGLLSFLYGL